MADVHPGRGGEDLAPRASPRDPERGDRRPCRLDDREHERGHEQPEDENRRARVPKELDQSGGAALDARAEEIGRARAQQAARRDRVAAVAPAVRPLERSRPLRLEVRPGRPVEERLLQLAPPALVGDPRVPGGRGPRIARDGADDREDLYVGPARVVTADARVGGAADVQGRRELVRVRACSRVDDGVGAVDDLELLVAPGRALRPLVRAVARLGRVGGAQRLRGVRGVEDQLDHLPVALVRVVEVVEGVEEPVLERELAGSGRVGRDVGVDRRRRALLQPARPLLVVAARVERAPREVEVVLVEAREVLGRRPDLHEVGGVPRAAERDRRVAEQAVDVHRPVRLARPAFLRLLDEPYDRRVLRREVLLRVRPRGDGAEKRTGQREPREAHEPTAPGKARAHGRSLRPRTDALCRRRIALRGALVSKDEPGSSGDRAERAADAPPTRRT